LRSDSNHGEREDRGSGYDSQIDRKSGKSLPDKFISKNLDETKIKKLEKLGILEKREDKKYHYIFKTKTARI
jgi:hypothetical protein